MNDADKVKTHYFFYSEEQEWVIRSIHRFTDHAVANFINGKQYTEWSNTNPPDNNFDDNVLVDTVMGTDHEVMKLTTSTKYLP